MTDNEAALSAWVEWAKNCDAGKERLERFARYLRREDGCCEGCTLNVCDMCPIPRTIQDERYIPVERYNKEPSIQGVRIEHRKAKDIMGIDTPSGLSTMNADTKSPDTKVI